MCGRCGAVAPPLRVVAAARSGQVDLQLDYDAATLRDAVAGPLWPTPPNATDLLWAIRLLFPASITPDGVEHHDVTTRDASVAAYRHLEQFDFVSASRWCRTLAEHHQVGRVLVQQLGPRPAGALNQKRSPDAQQRWLLHDEIDRHRRRLRTLELDPEQRDANHAAAEIEGADRAHLYRSRNRADARDRAQRRANRGDWLTPAERDLLGITR